MESTKYRVKRIKFKVKSGAKMSTFVNPVFGT